MTKEEALARARVMDSTATEFVVRLWDGFDGEWMDVTEAIAPDAAMEEWAKRTEDGKRATSYDDIDYYAIYPASVKMVWSEGRSMIRGDD